MGGVAFLGFSWISLVSASGLNPGGVFQPGPYLPFLQKNRFARPAGALYVCLPSCSGELIDRPMGLLSHKPLASTKNVDAQPSFQAIRRFLAAITAAPTDPMPRRVFADWLEGHGFQKEAEGQRQIAARNLGNVTPASRHPTTG